MSKNIKASSNNQKGGNTVGVININKNEKNKEDKGIWANPWFKNVLIVIITGVIVGLILMGANQMFGKDKTPKETYNVESNNQTGGIAAGKIENLTINSAPEKELYLSPNKKLIKPDMADYVFPFKIVNEKNIDFNDVALVILVPEDFGMYRIMIEPLDKTEKIVKYNGSMEIMLPGYGFPKDGYYWCIYNIESIYARETKEYSIKVNTRDYPEEFFMIFKWTSISDNPQLKEMFKGFGVE